MRSEEIIQRLLSEQKITVEEAMVLVNYPHLKLGAS